MHATIKQIRLDKGLSQKEVAKGYLSQSNYSKYENGSVDIPVNSFIGILENLNMSFDEVLYIHNGYKQSTKEALYQDFYNSPVKNLEGLSKFIYECEQYLSMHDDSLIRFLVNISTILKESIIKNDVSYAQEQAELLLKEYRHKETFFIKDIYMINSILFLFPTETAYDTLQYIEKVVAKYNDYNSINKILINLKMNISFMFINDGLYEKALEQLNDSVTLAKKYKQFIHLGIAYARIGLCHLQLNINGDIDYIKKGLTLLSVLEEDVTVALLKKELEKYAPSIELITN